MIKYLLLILTVLNSLFCWSQCEWKAKLQDDLYQSDKLAQTIFENPDLVDSWKVISNGKTSLRSADNIISVDAFKKANPDIAYDAIQSAFESIKSSGSRRQAFLNTLKNCTNNSGLINSLNKYRLATINEIRDAVNKLRNEMSGSNQSGNLGFIEGDIPGYNLNDNTFTKFWQSVSKEVAELETHIFDAIEATGTNGTWKRITDSEYRMLNDLAEQLGAVRGQNYPDITGTLKIVSQNPYCESCQGVIKQFSEMFPNIEITLIDGIQ